jgi:hypothetical protein
MLTLTSTAKNGNTIRPITCESYSPTRTHNTNGVKRITHVAPISSQVAFDKRTDVVAGMRRLYTVGYDDSGEEKLRFFCVLYDETKPRPTLRKRYDTVSLAHNMIITIYLQDFSIAIHDEDALSAYYNGLYQDRCVCYKNNKGDEYSITDFIIGSTVKIGSKQYHICDCDEFTREYCRFVIVMILIEVVNFNIFV